MKSSGRWTRCPATHRSSHLEQLNVSTDRSIAALTATGTPPATIALGLLLLIGP